MRKDVMADANLAIYAEVALFIFVTVFIAIALRAFFMSKDNVHQLERMPLDDGTITDSNKDEVFS